VLPPEPVALEADTTMLQQVFVNIVTNAMQAMEKDGRLTVSMQKTAEGPAEFVEVSFSDNGPGLTEEAKRKLFTPFFTGKSHGTGLGLAIAQRMIDAHHGVISAANNPDGGATFVVKLPLSRKSFAKNDGPDVSGKNA
jgi:signal transduction histidine kinase